MTSFVSCEPLWCILLTHSLAVTTGVWERCFSTVIMFRCSLHASVVSVIYMSRYYLTSCVAFLCVGWAPVTCQLLGTNYSIVVAAAFCRIVLDLFVFKYYAVYVMTNRIICVYFTGSSVFTSSELSVFVRLCCLMLWQDICGSVDGRRLVLDKLCVVLLWVRVWACVFRQTCCCRTSRVRC